MTTQAGDLWLSEQAPGEGERGMFLTLDAHDMGGTAWDLMGYEVRQVAEAALAYLREHEPDEYAKVVPQAELDRLRAVGEEMATELEYQRDLRVQQLGGIPDERAVLRELVEMHIRRIDARLKSYRKAVPE